MSLPRLRDDESFADYYAEHALNISPFVSLCHEAKWAELKECLENAFSPLWLDTNERASLMIILGMRKHGAAISVILEHINQFHDHQSKWWLKQALTQAIFGASLSNNKDLVAELKILYPTDKHLANWAILIAKLLRGEFDEYVSKQVAQLFYVYNFETKVNHEKLEKLIRTAEFCGFRIRHVLVKFSLSKDLFARELANILRANNHTLSNHDKEFFELALLACRDGHYGIARKYLLKINAYRFYNVDPEVYNEFVRIGYKEDELKRIFKFIGDPLASLAMAQCLDMHAKGSSYLMMFKESYGFSGVSDDAFISHIKNPPFQIRYDDFDSLPIKLEIDEFNHSTLKLRFLATEADRDKFRNFINVARMDVNQFSNVIKIITNLISAGHIKTLDDFNKLQDYLLNNCCHHPHQHRVIHPEYLLEFTFYVNPNSEYIPVYYNQSTSLIDFFSKSDAFIKGVKATNLDLLLSVYARDKLYSSPFRIPVINYDYNKNETILQLLREYNVANCHGNRINHFNLAFQLCKYHTEEYNISEEKCLDQLTLFIESVYLLSQSINNNELGNFLHELKVMCESELSHLIPAVLSKMNIKKRQLPFCKYVFHVINYITALPIDQIPQCHDFFKRICLIDNVFSNDSLKSRSIIWLLNSKNNANLSIDILAHLIESIYKANDYVVIDGPIVCILQENSNPLLFYIHDDACLVWAYERNDLRAFEKLLENGANSNSYPAKSNLTRMHSRNLLIESCFSPDKNEFLKKLLLYPVRFNINIQDGKLNALSAAYYYGGFDTFNLLLDSGADPNIQYSWGRHSILQQAICDERCEYILALLSSPWKIAVNAEILGNALKVAYKHRVFDLFNQLLIAGANPNLIYHTTAHTSLLYEACKDGQDQYVEVLLEHHATVTENIPSVAINFATAQNGRGFFGIGKHVPNDSNKRIAEMIKNKTRVRYANFDLL